MCVDAVTQSSPWRDSSHHHVCQDALCGERLVLDINDSNNLGADCYQSQSISAVGIDDGQDVHDRASDTTRCGGGGTMSCSWTVPMLRCVAQSPTPLPTPNPSPTPPATRM